MAYSTITKPSLHFNTLTYTGTGSSSTKTGVGFQPDLTWVKARNNTTWHYLYDAVRTAGIEKEIHSNSTAAEGASDGAAYGYLSAFASDGFSLYNGTSASQALNESGKNYVAWNWKANGAGSANTDGTISSTVSANTTAGFSIVKYTATGSNATVGHGLGAVPKMIIVKDFEDSGGSDWVVYHQSLGNGSYIRLNLTSDKSNGSTYWQDTTPTNSVFSIGTSSLVNNVGNDTIAYCFAEKAGYSKFGSYTGNGNADGTFVYTGFKPAFTIIKQSSASGQNWQITDNKRNSFNTVDKLLYANGTNSEVTSGSHPIDYLSNGFKCRGTGDGNNGSGKTYIYMAFAENPFVTSTGIPTTAR